MNFDAFIARFQNPRKTSAGWVTRCPSHEDKQASLSIAEKEGKILLKCFAGCSVNEIVAALGLQIKDLFPTNGNGNHGGSYPASYPRPSHPVEPEDPAPTDDAIAPQRDLVLERTYSYTDALGNEVYQALRYAPKTFRQRHMVEGEWVWNMNGVERVLYQLPKILTAEECWVLEGEKDAETVTRLGVVGTCNVGGAGKWLDAYSETLKGRKVVICGDNDKAGQAHVAKVFESLSGKAAEVRVVKIPQPHKDVTDFVQTFPNDQDAGAALQELRMMSVPFVGGRKFPVYSMADIEPKYARQAREMASVSFDFSRWLPSLGRALRPMIPGEVGLIVADTGAGKTMACQSVANAAPELRTLMFELELPEELLFERFISSRQHIEGRAVEQNYRSGDSIGAEALFKFYRNLLICPESGITLDEIERLVVKSELKFGAKTQMVLIDYAQLVSATGNSRYEKMSNIGEGIKVLAKRTRTIVFVASQMSRSKDGSSIPSLHSARDSSSLENSASVVIGLWRDAKDNTLMHLQVLKATKGGSGIPVECNFDGARSTITERSPIAPEDVPKSNYQPPYLND